MKQRIYDVTPLLRLKKCGCKILQKIKIFQMDDPSATSHLENVQATYDMGLRANFCRRTSCRFGGNSDGSSQVLYKFTHVYKQSKVGYI